MDTFGQGMSVKIDPPQATQITNTLTSTMKEKTKPLLLEGLTSSSDENEGSGACSDGGGTGGPKYEKNFEYNRTDEERLGILTNQFPRQESQTTSGSEVSDKVYPLLKITHT